MKRVAIATLGCKTNQFESAAMIEQFRQEGYAVVPFTQPADIYVVNSCTVTSRTDAETRRLIRRARRLNPEARIVATGCYAQVAPDELLQLPELDNVLGNREKRGITGHIEAGVNLVSDIAQAPGNETLHLETFAEHTRAFLQVQNGCDSFCSYCIVPYARGRSRSVPLATALGEVERLAANGYHEIVLTGIHLGGYGLDLTPQASLTALVRSVDAGRLVSRVRIGSVEPNEVSAELLELMTRSDRICPHFHLPLQSGSDTVLRRMGRQYDAASFAELVTRIKHQLPHAFIGADVIAGFPGESDEEHKETLRLIENLPLSDLHIFPYSRRNGTRAAAMAGQVPPAVIKMRSEELRRLAAGKLKIFLEEQRGQTLQVLVQGFDQAESICRGISANYVNVRFPGADDMVGKLVSVCIDTASDTLASGKALM